MRRRFSPNVFVLNTNTRHPTRSRSHKPSLVILLTSASSDALLMKRIPRFDPGRVTVQVSKFGSQLYIVPTETFLYSAA